MIGQVMICSVTILAVSNGAETPIALLVVILPWSLIFWVTFVFITLGTADKYIFKTFEPIVPSWLLPLLIVIEISSFIIRLFSLAIRVAANFTSGHILFFTLLTSLAAVYQILSFGGWFFIWPALVAVELLESAVVFIQTQVFLSLLLVYVSESLGSTIFLSSSVDVE
jgi:F-type H+-transporting ATPase subunit a